MRSSLSLYHANLIRIQESCHISKMQGMFHKPLITMVEYLNVPRVHTANKRAQPTFLLLLKFQVEEMADH